MKQNQINSKYIQCELIPEESVWAGLFHDHEEFYQLLPSSQGKTNPFLFDLFVI